MRIDTDLAHFIRQKSLDEGALIVGYTKIRRVEPVIIFGFPFTDKWFLKQPLNITKMLRKEYAISKHVMNIISKTLKDESYIVHQKTVLSAYGDFRPLAVSAGLGEWGRNGIIVNKDHGSGLLFGAIFTNAPIDPIIENKELESQKHCINCGQCIQACPSNVFQDGMFHTSRCFPYAIRGCAECLKVCKKKMM